MAKKAKFQLLRSLLIKGLFLGIVIGGYFVWKDPSLLGFAGEQIIENAPQVSNLTQTAHFKQSAESTMSKVLGKTTQLVEEGLQNLKVPKQLSGQSEEIVLEEVVSDFTKKIKNLPQDQIDRIKIQFCQDLLETVENASVEVNSQ